MASSFAEPQGLGVECSEVLWVSVQRDQPKYATYGSLKYKPF